MSEHQSRECAYRSARELGTGITGLSERSAGFWEVSNSDAISYPPGGHASFAEVEETSYWFNHRNAVIASIVGRFPPGGLIADVGGGNGYVSLGLRRAGFESVVIEPGAVGAHCAHDRGLPVVMAPFEKLALPAGSLAAAGLFDVLEHIDDDAATLAQLRTYLQPRGRLYLTVPAFNWLWSSEDDHAGHFRRYTLDSLSTLLIAQGFEVEFATYFFAPLVAPILALRSLPTRLKLGKANQPAAVDVDHRLPSGIVGTTLSHLLSWEAARIARGSTVPFGSSCLLVARRADGRTAAVA